MGIDVKHIRAAFIAALIVTGLYLTKLYSDLLFHTLVEMFSVVIASSIFLVAWNAKKYIRNSYLLLIGIAYFFVAGLDILQILSFDGVNVFENETFSSQAWIAARYFESLSFCAAFILIKKKWRFNPYLVFFILTFLYAVAAASIFWWQIFPETFRVGSPTLFKIASEYIIAGIFLIAMALANRYRNEFDPKVRRWVLWSLAASFFSELAFAVDISDDFTLLAGHYLKALSFYLIYKAIVEIAFSQPIALLFRELKLNEIELKNLNVTKDKFFSIIAHDLKSPFNSLIGFSELLITKYDAFSDEERKRLFLLINNSSKRAHNLLDNLLQWSRTQTGTLRQDPEKFDVGELIRDNIELLSGSAKEKNIALLSEVSEPQYVMADKNMINTVIRNLVNNAIKFTPREGKVTLSAQLNGAHIAIAVADTGIGISEEDREKLFKLDQIKTMTGQPKEKGSGLGLIICKEFVEKNYGKIEVQSEPGRGSRFTFTLPKA